MSAQTSRYPGACTVCGRNVSPGGYTERSSAGKWVVWHRSCGRQVAPGAAAKTSPVRDGSNSREGSCVHCNAVVAAGAGILLDRDSLEDQGHYAIAERMRGRWGVSCGESQREACRARCKTGLALKIERAEKEQARADGEKRGKAFREAEMKAELFAVTEAIGLVRTEHSPVGACVTGSFIFEAFEDRYGQTVTVRPIEVEGWIERALVEQHTSYGDHRVYYWMPPRMAEKAWRAWAEECGITREKALSWLEKYGQCSGSEAYRFVAEMERAS